MPHVKLASEVRQTYQYSRTPLIRVFRDDEILKNKPRITGVRVLQGFHNVTNIIKGHTYIASHIYLNVSQSAQMDPCQL